jgi:hypothetical protein
MALTNYTTYALATLLLVAASGFALYNISDSSPITGLASFVVTKCTIDPLANTITYVKGKNGVSVTEPMNDCKGKKVVTRTCETKYGKSRFVERAKACPRVKGQKTANVCIEGGTCGLPGTVRMGCARNHTANLVVWNNREYRDLCSPENLTLVQKYVCEDGKAKLTKADKCPWGSTCANGACGLTSPSPCTGPTTANPSIVEKVSYVTGPGGRMQNHTDACLIITNPDGVTSVSRTKVRDWICADGKPDSVVLDCAAGTWCDDGACVASAFKCEDNDNGLNTTKRGLTRVFENAVLHNYSKALAA